MEAVPAQGSRDGGKGGVTILPLAAIWRHVSSRGGAIALRMQPRLQLALLLVRGGAQATWRIFWSQASQLGVLQADQPPHRRGGGSTATHLAQPHVAGAPGGQAHKVEKVGLCQAADVEPRLQLLEHLPHRKAVQVGGTGRQCRCQESPGPQ